MGIWTFIRSRQAFIVTYAGFAALTVLIVQLDLWLSHSRLQFVNVLYLFLLGCVLLVSFLLGDYRRWLGYLRRLTAVTDAESLDSLGILPAARTVEQEIFSQAWAALYARLRAEIIDERQKGRRNIELISQWAHHMKTPVAIVDLELQKAGKQAASPELAAVLASVAEENQRLQQSLQALLNMVRLEQFSTDLRMEPVDLLALVRRLINDHKRDFLVHRVFPKMEQDAYAAAPRQCQVLSDAKWLRFVLEQIVSNAIKYSSAPDRDGCVTFRCNRAENETVLEVADNGIGICAEDLGQVCKPFFTGANGRAYPQSTGMGLYLAQETCNRLGHRLELQSQPGRGTSVYLHFVDSQVITSGLQVTLPPAMTQT